MLGTVPEMLLRYKAVIRDGYALPFGEGMQLERNRSRAFNASVEADTVEARREAVRSRNRGGVIRSGALVRPRPGPRRA
jgi:enoyl-CoA hydratase